MNDVGTLTRVWLCNLLEARILVNVKASISIRDTRFHPEGLLSSEYSKPC